MAINKEKYVNAVLFFIKHCNNHLGTTKLNKLFYYLDFISYRDNKITVTNDCYVHQKFGPVPACLENDILPHMKKEGLILIENIPLEHDDGHRVSFKTDINPDLSIFNDYEKRLLQRICDEFRDYNTEAIVRQTHAEAPWYYSEYMNIIDFENAQDIDILENVQ